MAQEKLLLFFGWFGLPLFFLMSLDRLIGLSWHFFGTIKFDLKGEATELSYLILVCLEIKVYSVNTLLT